MIKLIMVFKLEFRGKIIGNNQRYAFRGNKVNSRLYEDFKTEVGWLCRQQNPREKMLCEDVEICIIYNSQMDIDNICKGILDALQGIVYPNDNKVKKLTIQKSKAIGKGFRLIAHEMVNHDL